jgi:hypothetical protein
VDSWHLIPFSALQYVFSENLKNTSGWIVGYINKLMFATFGKDHVMDANLGN